jgi:hypothetical protein
MGFVWLGYPQWRFCHVDPLTGMQNIYLDMVFCRFPSSNSHHSTVPFSLDTSAGLNRVEQLYSNRFLPGWLPIHSRVLSAVGATTPPRCTGHMTATALPTKIPTQDKTGTIHQENMTRIPASAMHLKKILATSTRGKHSVFIQKHP